MRNTGTLLFLCATLFTCPNVKATDEWPEFRGPHGNGHATGSHLPTHWSETDSVRWKVETPGLGWSTPLISGDHIWMSAASEDGRELFALCVHRADGNLLHHVPLFEIEEPEPKNAMNSYASPTGVIADGRVFFSFGTYGVACLNVDTGDLLWSRNNVNLDHQEGPGSSLVLFRDRVLLHCDGRDVQYLTSLDCETWRHRLANRTFPRSVPTSAITPARPLQLRCWSRQSRVNGSSAPLPRVVTHTIPLTAGNSGDSHIPASRQFRVRSYTMVLPTWSMATPGPGSTRSGTKEPASCRNPISRGLMVTTVPRRRHPS